MRVVRLYRWTPTFGEIPLLHILKHDHVTRCGYYFTVDTAGALTGTQPDEYVNSPATCFECLRPSLEDTK
jgi:hypothetical protein